MSIDNSISLLGRLVKDPVERTSKSNKNIVFLTIGRSKMSRDDFPFETVVAFGKNADRIAKELHVGDLLLIHGYSIKRKNNKITSDYTIYETSYIITEYKIMESKDVRNSRRKMRESNESERSEAEERFDNLDPDELKKYLEQTELTRGFTLEKR